MHSQTPRRLAPLFLFGLLTGCPERSFDHEITEVRVVDLQDVNPDASTAQRFGFRERLFLWNTPAGWREMAPTQLRLVNFQAGPEGTAECYLTQLSGGDALSNVNRWRGQMGLEPLGNHELAALPRTSLLGREAIAVDLTGSFTGMGDQAQEDMRMLALYADFPAFALTVKMVGPADVVAAEVQHFQSFCASLEFNLAAFSIPSAQSTNTATGSDAARPGLVPATSGFDPASLTWDSPDSWNSEGPSGMRLASFTVPGKPGSECYITVLNGAAGGIAANINRWRNEMQAPALSEAEIAALPTLEVLGASSPILDVDGSFTSMRGESIDQARMLAIVCPLETHTVFVKMIGPADELATERPNFIAFCESLASQ